MITNFISTTKHDFKLFYEKITLPKNQAPSDERVINAACRTLGTFSMVFGTIYSINVITQPSISLARLVFNVLLVVAGRDIFYGYSKIDPLLKAYNAVNSPSIANSAALLSHSNNNPFKGMILRPVYEAFFDLCNKVSR